MCRSFERVRFFPRMMKERLKSVWKRKTRPSSSLDSFLSIPVSFTPLCSSHSLLPPPRPRHRPARALMGSQQHSEDFDGQIETSRWNFTKAVPSTRPAVNDLLARNLIVKFPGIKKFHTGVLRHSKVRCVWLCRLPAESWGSERNRIFNRAKQRLEIGTHLLYTSPSPSWQWENERVKITGEILSAPPSWLRSRVDNLACSSSCARLFLEEKEKITKKKVRKAEAEAKVPVFMGSVSPIERRLGVWLTGMTEAMRWRQEVDMRKQRV